MRCQDINDLEKSRYIDGFLRPRNELLHLKREI